MIREGVADAISAPVRVHGSRVASGRASWDAPGDPRVLLFAAVPALLRVGRERDAEGRPRGGLHTIVELGAGTAPITRLLADNPDSAGVKLVVSDLNPDRPVYEALEKKYPGRVTAVMTPVDISVPQQWDSGTLVILSAAFHHLPPESPPDRHRRPHPLRGAGDDLRASAEVGAVHRLHITLVPHRPPAPALVPRPAGEAAPAVLVLAVPHHDPDVLVGGGGIEPADVEQEGVGGGVQPTRPARPPARHYAKALLPDGDLVNTAKTLTTSNPGPKCCAAGGVAAAGEAVVCDEVGANRDEIHRTRRAEGRATDGVVERETPRTRPDDLVDALADREVDVRRTAAWCSGDSVNRRERQSPP